MSKKIDVSFQVGDVVVDAATIKSISFVAFCAYVNEAQGMTSPKAFESRLKRVRMLRQVEYSTKGKPVALDTAKLLQMPIAAGKIISDSLDDDEGPAGKILNDGDGISSPILYELGMPIPVANGEPLKEIELQASTYGQLEDMLAATNPLQQTEIMLRTLAKPVHSSLSALPSWAIDKITIADGVILARSVLPKWLG